MHYMNNLYKNKVREYKEFNMSSKKFDVPKNIQFSRYPYSLTLSHIFNASSRFSPATNPSPPFR